MSRTVATPVFPQESICDMQLFLLPSGCSCCHVAVHHILICNYSSPVFECGYFCYHPASPCHHVAILAAVRLFLPSCDCSCCPAANLAAMQPLIIAMWIYSCCHTAIPATMWLFLLPFSHKLLC